MLSERQMHMTIKEVNVFSLLQQGDRDEDHLKEKVWGFIEVEKQRSHTYEKRGRSVLYLKVRAGWSFVVSHPGKTQC